MYFFPLAHLSNAAFSHTPVLSVTPVPKSIFKWYHPTSFPHVSLNFPLTKGSAPVDLASFSFPGRLHTPANQIAGEELNWEHLECRCGSPAQEMPGWGQKLEYASGASQMLGTKRGI